MKAHIDITDSQIFTLFGNRFTEQHPVGVKNDKGIPLFGDSGTHLFDCLPVQQRFSAADTEGVIPIPVNVIQFDGLDFLAKLFLFITTVGTIQVALPTYKDSKCINHTQ
jgi:hypothetical protein